MSNRSDSAVEAAVRARVPEPVLAEGWFHVFSGDIEPDRIIVIPIIRWLARKRLSQMPRHSYWVVTASRIHVFEFRFGSTAKLHRVLGPWDRDSLLVESNARPNSMFVRLPGTQRTFEMEGDRWAFGEREVIRLLTHA